MVDVFSDEELSANDPIRRLFDPLNRRSWLFTRRRISRVEPMEPKDFLHLFRCRLNYTCQARMSHHNVSFHLLMLFEWHFDVMEHHGVHVGITSNLLAESRLVIALRRYEHWAISHGADWPCLSVEWDFVRSVARRMKRRLLKMSRENSCADEDE